MVDVVRTDDFDQWLRKLKDRVGRLRIVERLDRLAAGNPGDAKPVGRGVWELRLRFGPGYQQRDIDRAYQLAEKYWREEGHDHG